MLPARVVRRFPLVRIFAPLALWGEVLALPCNGEVLVYLSPELEQMPQRCVNYVVAHEFAHVALGHYGPGFPYADTLWVAHHDEKPEEQAADALVVEWGYPARDNPVHISAEGRRLEREEEDERIAREVEEENRRIEEETRRVEAELCGQCLPPGADKMLRTKALPSTQYVQLCQTKMM